MAVIDGTSGANNLVGLASDDLITGFGGDDTIDGAGGQDIAIYSGPMAGYYFSLYTGSDGSAIYVGDIDAGNGFDGLDQIRNIESIQFSDGTLTLSSGSVNAYTIERQSEPVMSTLAGGGVVVAWTSTGQDGSGDGICAQRYDGAGRAQGLEFRINTFTTGNQSDPAISALADGGFVVTWTSTGEDGNGDGVYAQRYNAVGVAQGTEFCVNTFTSSNQHEPAVTALSNGGFLVTWTSQGQVPSNFSSVFAQHFDAAGVAQGGEIQVNTYTFAAQKQSAVATLADGGFVVAWASGIQDGDLDGVFARRFDANGVAKGPEIQVNTHTLADQNHPAVAALTNGGFVVTWSSFGQDGSGDSVYAQRFDASGIAQGSEFRISTLVSVTEFAPAISSLSDGGFAVVFRSFNFPYPSYSAIDTQRYNADGTLHGAASSVVLHSVWNLSDCSRE
jgi:RTX calcium-binding nonapeptide repeat (4 copies)